MNSFLCSVDLIQKGWIFTIGLLQFCHQQLQHRSGLWLFRIVAVSVCDLSVSGRSGLWPIRSVAFSVCGRFGLWSFRFAAVSVVAVSVCGRYYLLPSPRLHDKASDLVNRTWSIQNVSLNICCRSPPLSNASLIFENTTLQFSDILLSIPHRLEISPAVESAHKGATDPLHIWIRTIIDLEY